MWVRADDRDARVTGEQVEPVALGYKGQLYLLHLGPQNRARLDELINPWLDGLTPHRPLPTLTDHTPKDETTPVSDTKADSGSSRRRIRTGRNKARPDLQLIRTWAREQGHNVTTAGRIKAEIIDAYDAAHLSGAPITGA